jgi:trehalose 6-phosphate phosphatase
MGMISDLQPPPLPGAGESWALFLDIDGTLVGFEDDPALVAIGEPLQRLMPRLQSRLGGALAVLSGRCLAEVDALFEPLRLPAGALHGHEFRDSSGKFSVLAPPPDVAAQVGAQAREWAAALAGVTLESKGGIGFALHFRLAPEQARAAAEAAESIAHASAGAYEVQHGDCVAELKPVGADKGAALKRLMEHPPFRGRRPVMVGDDLTDELAFAVAEHLGGFGIVVGARRPTAARYCLSGPAGVHDWLDRLAGNPSA